jgi:hypothetical protein
MPISAMIENFPRGDTGGRLIIDCAQALNTPTSLIASILNVTWKEAVSWYRTRLTDEPQGKIDRLKRLHKVISLAQQQGIPDNLIANLLVEELPGNDDGCSLLYFIIDQPESDKLDELVKSVCPLFIDRKSNELRKLYGVTAYTDTIDLSDRFS